MTTQKKILHTAEMQAILDDYAAGRIKTKEFVRKIDVAFLGKREGNMKRIDFESEWNEYYSVGLLRITGMTGIERGFGRIWEYEGWVIESQAAPEFFPPQKLYVWGFNKLDDNQAVFFKNQDAYNKAIEVLNAFNEAHSEPETEIPISHTPNEYENYTVLLIKTNGELIYFGSAQPLDVACRYKKYRGMLYRDSCGELLKKACRDVVLEAAGFDLIGVLWEKEGDADG